MFNLSDVKVWSKQVVIECGKPSKVVKFSLLHISIESPEYCIVVRITKIGGPARQTFIGTDVLFQRATLLNKEIFYVKRG